MYSDDDDVRSVLAALSYYAGRSLPSHLIGVAHQHGLTTGGWLYPQISPPITSGGERPEQDLLSFGRSLRERARDAGIIMLTRADTGWPTEHIGDQLPCLWVRGDSNLAALLDKAVTITGARACTAYGTHMASQLTHDVATAGCTVVTGASVGINASAAISALTGDKPALVLIAAAGLDHHYTSTTISGLVTKATQRSTVISAFPPGRTPGHASWELTDRLLGTVSAATVIVEAHPVSRSLRCAHAAADAGRAVGAVPGPITSGVSAGCHRLLSDGVAQFVTHAGDILTAISSPPASHGTWELYQITAVAQWHDGQWRTRPVPPFAVRAASYAHAANTAFDVVFAEQYNAATLTVGVMDPRGVYQDVNVDVRRPGTTAGGVSIRPVTDAGPAVSATPSRP